MVRASLTSGCAMPLTPWRSTCRMRARASANLRMCCSLAGRNSTAEMESVSHWPAVLPRPRVAGCCWPVGPRPHSLSCCPPQEIWMTTVALGRSEPISNQDQARLRSPFTGADLQHVSVAPNGDDLRDAGCRRCGSPHFPAQRSDVNVERLRRAEPVLVPDVRHQRLPTQRRLGLRSQAGQQVELLRTQLQLPPRDRRTTTGEVDDQVSDGSNRSSPPRDRRTTTGEGDDQVSDGSNRSSRPLVAAQMRTNTGP